jgi:hypothetical protein
MVLACPLSALADDGFPAVRRARGNTFAGNDIAIDFPGGSAAMSTQSTASDFGTSGDHGTQSSASNGTDVRVTAGTPPAIDLSGATPNTAACPSGRTP